MFLAWQEIKHSKSRYMMVIALMFLIAYLVYFLTGLAYGLAQSNRTAIDKWNADQILLAKDVNASLRQSMIPQEYLDTVEVSGEKAGVSQRSAVIQSNRLAEKEDVNYLGIDIDSFLAPNIVEGKSVQSKNEVVADLSLKEEKGLRIGDEVTMTGNDTSLKVVGFTDKAQLSVMPVLYMNLETFRDVMAMPIQEEMSTPFNGIVVRGKTISYDEDKLDLFGMSDFIEALPGYSAQNMTFIFMIVFLMVIAAVVIGIFMYILTMQKTQIFGVMKAEGISSGFISQSVICQTAILALIGLVVGTLATYGTAMVLPAAVPFQINNQFMVLASGLMFVVAIMGSLFSVRTIANIDPLDAIG